jgi:hypothetical protein
MQVIDKIDKLIAQLNNLKPELLDDPSNNANKFNELLKSTMETNYKVTHTGLSTEPSPKFNFEKGIPSWVDQNYSYDPQNPRKPNMREMMEAISGKAVEELFTETEENWQKISSQASEILYGVVGSNEDTRDWRKINRSENILKSAQEQTGLMYEPTVDIVSNFDATNNLTEQIAVIKDKQGNTLRSLPSNLTLTEEMLHNFGVKSGSIPKNLEDKIDPNIFDKNLLTFLKAFDAKPASLEKIIVQSTNDIIAKKVSNELTLEELAKL